MKDILFEEFIKKEYWDEALEIAYYKGISRRAIYYLSNPENRLKLFESILKEEYAIAPPRTQKIPKDKPNEFRTVYINEDIDRIILSVINIVLNVMTRHWISEFCTSYQKGIGSGKVVQHVSKWICEGNKNEVGRKGDLTKYFDSVPIEQIDKVFNRLEKEFGKSCIITLLRKYYHQNTCYVEGKLIEHYQSLKQGCAVASWLANVLLYDLDEEMAKICNGQYVRYSDDVLFICDNYEFAEGYLTAKLNGYGLTLNPKKVEKVYKDKWIKFLGFSIKGTRISISKNRFENFKKEIVKLTLKKKISFKKAVNSVIRFLYVGNGEYSWATTILPIINCKGDLDCMNRFVMDCLRATYTNRKNIAGIGYEPHEDGVIVYRPSSCKVFTLPNGHLVTSKYGDSSYNRKVVKHVENYYSLLEMQNALHYSKELYMTLVREMMMHM